MLIQIVTLIFIVAGVGITIVALFGKNKDNRNEQNDRNTNRLEHDTALRKMEEHMIEIDKTLEEFHSTANSAIVELDEKYQELLFLYSLIDEKKKEVDNIYSVGPTVMPPPVALEPPKAEQAPKRVKPRSNHPRHMEILNLSEQGLSVAEIAKELNVGQDMVKLILEMGKDR